MYYRHKVTGQVQHVPGPDRLSRHAALNLIPLGADGTPVKPFVDLPITPDKIKKATRLATEAKAPMKNVKTEPAKPMASTSEKKTDPKSEKGTD